MPINIDGITDDCSLGKDINFIFTGFSVSGMVVSHKKDSGPAGVTVDLFSGNSETALKTYITENGGLFNFQNVFPGAYKIVTSHSNWKFVSNELKLNVGSNSVSITEGLEVLGYGVRGRVISDGEPIQGVIFSLYSQAEDISSSCGLEPVAAEVINENWKTVCQTVSDLKGQFLFPVVPSGKYKLIPLYQGESIKFDIQPSVADFEVEDGDILLTQIFEVNQ